jgi:hypothetical protein
VDGVGSGGGFLGLNEVGVSGGGFEERAEAVAELGDGVAEGEQAGEQCGAGEVEGVSGGVEVAFEGCGLFAAEGKRDGSEVEAGGLSGRRRGAVARGVDGGRRSGLEQEIAQRDGTVVERVNLQGLVGELQFSGEDGLGRSC